MSQEAYIHKAEENLIHTYNRYQIVLDKGDGVYLYDIDGKKYLDFTAGIAVFALGYNNKKYNDALKAQIDKILHTSNYFYTIPMAEAAEKFVKNSGMSRVFFTNSGTESIEGAIKLARKYFNQKHQDKSPEIIAMKHSFHGRSTGALAVTGNPKYQEPFQPLMPGVVFAEYNNLDSVKALVNENTCAILLETIQGEGGIYPASQEFMDGIRKICDDNDILMICDEIQCGMGRCGTMFAYQGYGIQPDIITSAKALGCGVPIGAFAACEKVENTLEAGDHGTTYGGNPFATAAASIVFDLFEEEHILEHVNEISKYLVEKLEKLKEEYKCIVEIRGKGLMQGIAFNKPAGEITAKALGKGLVLITAGTNVIRLVPPLTITKENIDEMISILKTCI